MSRSGNIWILEVEGSDDGKYYIQCNMQKKEPEVELNVFELTEEKQFQECLNRNKNVTGIYFGIRNDTTTAHSWKNDTQDKRGSEGAHWGTVTVVLVVIILGIVIVTLVIVVTVIMVKKQVAWMGCKKSKSVPKPVQITSHRDSPESTSYLLMWDKPDDGGCQLQQYRLRYQEVDIIRNNPEYKLSQALSEFISVDNILPSAVSYKLSELMPGRYYQVEIQAMNSQGQSFPQYCIFKTREDVPQPVQITSQCDSPNPTSYLLMWNKPDDGGSQLQQYRLRYQEVEIIPYQQEYKLSQILHEFDPVDNIPASAVNYKLSSLMPGRYYQVEIHAINAHGQSFPQSFIFKTKEGIPKPVQITSQRDSPDPTSYLLMWNRPDDGGSQLQQYRLRYQEVEIIPNKPEYELSRVLCGFISVDNILPSAVSYKLSSLMPGRYYLVEIQAINAHGESLKSFVFKTKEGVPQPVQIISHWVSPNSTSYLLMWNRPDDGGCQLQQYRLRYQEVEIVPNATKGQQFHTVTSFTSPQTIPLSTTSCMLSSLMPGKYYNVEIQAINRLGPSLPESFIFKTKESTTDHLPPTKEKVDGRVTTDQLPPTMEKADDAATTDHLPPTKEKVDGRATSDQLPPTMEKADGTATTDHLLPTKEKVDGRVTAHHLPPCNEKAQGTVKPPNLKVGSTVKTLHLAPMKEKVDGTVKTDHLPPPNLKVYHTVTTDHLPPMKEKVDVTTDHLPPTNEKVDVKALINLYEMKKSHDGQLEGHSGQMQHMEEHNMEDDSDDDSVDCMEPLLREHTQNI